MIEVAFSSVVPALAVLSGLLALIIITIMGICSSAPKTVPEVDMTNYGNTTLAAPQPSSPQGSLPVGGRDQMPSYKLFTETGADGVVGDRETPETFTQKKENFDMKSVNFAIFTDFRGPNVEESAAVQEKVARDVKGVSGMFTKSSDDHDNDHDSEYDSEYDSEEEEPEVQEPVVQVQKPPPPSPAPKRAYEDDLDANITYQHAGDTQQRTQGAGPGVIQSLAFTPEEVKARMAEVGASTKSRRRVKKSVKIKRRKEVPEVERKKKKVKRRRRKVADEEEEIDESIMNPTNI